MRVRRGVIWLVASIAMKISSYLKHALNYTSVKFQIQVRRIRKNKLCEICS